MAAPWHRSRFPYYYDPWNAILKQNPTLLSQQNLKNVTLHGTAPLCPIPFLMMKCSDRGQWHRLLFKIQCTAKPAKSTPWTSCKKHLSEFLHPLPYTSLDCVPFERNFNLAGTRHWCWLYCSWIKEYLFLQGFHGPKVHSPWPFIHSVLCTERSV